MATPMDVFLDAVDKADSAVREMFLAMREGGVDMDDSSLARRVRSIDTALGAARDEVEDVGLTP